MVPQLRGPMRRNSRIRNPIPAAVATLAIVGCASATSIATARIDVDVPDPPKVTDVTCTKTCGGIRIATENSLVTVSGRHLNDVKKVKFHRKGGGWLTTQPASSEAKQATARVPVDAETGRVRVVDSLDRTAESTVKLKIVDPKDIPEAAEFALKTAETTPKVVYVGGRQAARLKYSFAAKGPTDIRIDVVKADSNAIVASMTERRKEPFAGNQIDWNGKGSSGKPAPAGNYKFKVGPVSAGSGKSKPKASFRMISYKFPILGRHSYGDGYGAGRGHDGQDVFARCGTPLVAVRGGRIQANSYQSAAGNYVILDPVGTKKDYIYMHLKSRSPLRAGKRVFTGQRLGKVGATGRATGCHLHFEIWSAPGAWTDGGHPLPSVTRILKRWDKQS